MRARDAHVLPVHTGVQERAVHWMWRHRQRVLAWGAGCLLLMLVAVMQAEGTKSAVRWINSDGIRMPIHVQCLPPPMPGAAHTLGRVTLCQYDRARFGQVRAPRWVRPVACRIVVHQLCEVVCCLHAGAVSVCGSHRA